MDFLDTEPKGEKDTVLLINPLNDTLYYSRQALDTIARHFPVLTQAYPDPPEIAYARSGYYKDIPGQDESVTRISFGSEIGHDEFCLLYAHFLRKQYSDKTYPHARKQLTEIFLTLNTIFGTLSYGGTYFGHQTSRLAADAEYGSYRLNKYPIDLLPTYNSEKQKKLYLDLLRQEIADELAVDKETTGAEKRREREKTLYGYVEQLDKLITDGFLLREAQRYQQRYY